MALVIALARDETIGDKVSVRMRSPRQDDHHVRQLAVEQLGVEVFVRRLQT